MGLGPKLGPRFGMGLSPKSMDLMEGPKARLIWGTEKFDREVDLLDGARPNLVQGPIHLKGIFIFNFHIINFKDIYQIQSQIFYFLQNLIAAILGRFESLIF